jgi:hypothetical protein
MSLLRRSQISGLELYVAKLRIQEMIMTGDYYITILLWQVYDHHARFSLEVE